MNLIKLISKLKKKTVEPKFYSLVLRCSTNDFTDWTHIWSGVEYDLEHAMGTAKAETINKMEKQLNQPLREVKVELWTITPVINIINQSCDTDLKKTKINETEKKENKQIDQKTEKLIKNEILAEIIKNKDKNLFEENKEIFSTAEVKYIKNSLKT